MTTAISRNLLNRANRRNIAQDIPHRHAIVLAKIAEMCGHSMQLLALQMLYHKQTISDRNKMITTYLQMIRENDTTTPKEQSNG